MLALLFSTSLLIAAAPEARVHDLYELAGELDLAERAEIDDALANPELYLETFSELEEDASRRAALIGPRTRAGAIAVGFGFAFRRSVDGETRGSEVLWTFDASLAFDIWFEPPPAAPYLVPREERRRAELCIRLSALPHTWRDDALSILLSSALARRELVERGWALACAGGAL